MIFLAHEGHHVSSVQLIHWIGYFHPVVLHFPIALIVSTVFAELLLFKQAARFMIILAALSAIPTVVCGFFFAYGNIYEGLQASFFWWHRFLGIWTAALAILTAVLKEGGYHWKWRSDLAYFLCLFVLFISVTIGGFLGGALTFGMPKG